MLRLGQEVKSWGKVAAIGYPSGERYYWFVDKHGTVSMIDAKTAEEVAGDASQNTDTKSTHIS